MKYIAAVAILLMALAIPGINIYHHLVIPDFTLNHVDVSYSVDFKSPYIHKNVDITLPDIIHNRSLTFYSVMKVLRDAHVNDIITFHLQGYGGSVQDVTMLIDGVKASKAHVVMSVESSVYSGHAYLALSVPDLKVSPDSYIMMHSSDILNEDCSKKTGLDRGTSNVLHCQKYFQAAVYQNTKLISELYYLTNDERKLILTGYDVYIQADDMNSRIHSKSADIIRFIKP